MYCSCTRSIPVRTSGELEGHSPDLPYFGEVVHSHPLKARAALSVLYGILFHIVSVYDDTNDNDGRSPQGH